MIKLVHLSITQSQGALQNNWFTVMMQRLRCIHEKIQNRKSVMISVLDFLRTLIRLSVFCVLSMLASLQKSEYSKSVEACLGRKKRLFCNSPFTNYSYSSGNDMPFSINRSCNSWIYLVFVQFRSSSHGKEDQLLLIHVL